MIEADLESKVLEKIQGALTGVDAQYIGIWQVEETKGCEDSKPVVVAVKALPRAYETPTIPYATIEVAVSLAVRADEDYTGTNYLEVTAAIQDQLQKWQDSFTESNTDFTIDGKFDETGFQLGGGDCGMDKDLKVWQFSQSFTIYGIINKEV